MSTRSRLAALALTVCMTSWPTPPGVVSASPPATDPDAAAIEQLLAEAGGDTVRVLLDQLAAVRLDWRLERIEWKRRAEVDSLTIAWQQAALREARPRWYQEVARDARLWCLVGILAGALAAGN